MTTGLDNMLSNFNDVKTPGTAAIAGAALFIKAESQKICPVDTANLIGGAYADIISETPNVVTSEIGYQAFYAPFVHEAPETTNWQKPAAENKFLEKALMRNEHRIMGIIGAETRGFRR